MTPEKGPYLMADIPRPPAVLACLYLQTKGLSMCSRRSATLALIVTLAPAFALAANWSGDIPNGTIWPTGQVQIADADIRVPPGATLTIQAGAVVKLGY